MGGHGLAVTEMKMGKLEKKFVNTKKREEKNIRLVEHLASQGGIDLHDMKKALDIGCGVGFVARYLGSTYGMEVHGVDVDPEQIKTAGEYSGESEGLHFAVADTTQLPFEDDSFDLVLSFMVIHHVGDWRRALDEVGRVLKPEGLYIFYEITYPGFLARVFRSSAKNFGIFTREELKEYLDNNNYQVIYEETGRHLAFGVLKLIARKV
jgi:ubiquinone/menaquinone biosynthesis C-methylase UbiE